MIKYYLLNRDNKEFVEVTPRTCFTKICELAVTGDYVPTLETFEHGWTLTVRDRDRCLKAQVDYLEEERHIEN